MSGADDAAGPSRASAADATTAAASGQGVEGWSRVCPSDALAERSDGVRFDVARRGGSVPAFVLRIDGRPTAYLNQCAHVPVELDWTPGRFLDDTGTVIVCATHGAVYDAADGACVGGPCRGQSLRQVPAREADGWIEVQAMLVQGER